MKVKIEATEQPERLADNLERRARIIEVEDDVITAEVENPKPLSRVPGIETFKVNGEERKGLGGKPIGEQAYARIESKRDAVRAFLATLMGYDLRVLDASREWDYRNLKRYNPDIKHLKFAEPRDELDIEKALFETGDLEKIEIELEEEEVEEVYREMLV